MSRKPMEYPSCVLPMGKARTEVNATIFRHDLVRIEFSEYEVRKVKYRGLITLTRENGHFIAHVFDHRYSLTRIDQPWAVDGVSRSAKEAMIKDAGATVDKLYAESPELFLDGEVAHAHADLVRAEDEVERARDALAKAEEKAEGCAAVLERARTARRSFRKA